MKIQVEKPAPSELAARQVDTWPIWEKEVSRFDWHYDAIEECYLLEGEVVVETLDGEQVAFGAGDFVTFPKDLSCVWDVKKPVRKHYRFKPS
ncbi:MAG: cupin domain-containing protein [Desulfobacterales bacterium]|nr:cupin domain-containing protein [Desulfobacterales bacterium]